MRARIESKHSNQGQVCVYKHTLKRLLRARDVTLESITETQLRLDIITLITQTATK